MPTPRSLRDPESLADCRRLVVRHVQCHSCGYEPPADEIPAGRPPTYCPKCHGGCWERFVHLGKLRPAGAPVPDDATALDAAHAPQGA